MVCRLYSLVLFCRQANVDPQAYLKDALAKVATTPAREIAFLWANPRQEASQAGA